MHDTLNPNSAGNCAVNRLISVPFPTPDGPAKTSGLYTPWSSSPVSIYMWGVVTGASQGIGLALLTHLASTRNDVTLLGVARRVGEIPALSNVCTLACDLSTDDGRSLLVEFLRGKEVAFLVHSAASMGELSLEATTVAGFRSTVSLILETPLFVTQAVSDCMPPGSRVLLVSSGAADSYGIVRSPAFSVAKAGGKMLQQVFNVEFQAKGIVTGTVNPGITDTPMLADWVATHACEGLAWEKVCKPRTVAKFLGFLLGERVSGERFGREKWNIYDKNQQKEWVEEGEQGPEVPFAGGAHAESN